MPRKPGTAVAKANGNGQAGEDNRGVMAALSEMMGRSRFMQRLGFQYRGNRDIYATAGYKRELSFADYYAVYKRQDIAAVIVDMKAETTWRHPPEIREEGMDPENPTEFVLAFNKLAKRLRLWSEFERTDKLSGIGQYGVMLIGTPGTDQELQRPVTNLQEKDIIYLQAYHQGLAKIESWVTDIGNPRFGLPELYELEIGSDTVKGFATSKVIVHASRVIHVAEDRMTDNVHGRPRLERVFNRLFDLEKVASSTGESFWQLANRILQAKTDADAAITPEQIEKLGTRLEEMVHDLRRQFIGQGVELDWLTSVPADPRGAMDFLFTIIAAGAQIPKRILFGSETGERASEQDQRTYLGGIVERQQTYAEPEMLREFVDRMIAWGALPKPKAKDGDYICLWPTLWEESDKEIAEANLSRARAARDLTPIGGDPRLLVEVDEDRNIWLLPTDGENATIHQPDPLPGEDVLPTGEGRDTEVVTPAGRPRLDEVEEENSDGVSDTRDDD